jgi:hypothetical protein
MYPKREDVRQECRNCMICTLSQISEDQIKENVVGVCIKTRNEETAMIT